MLTDVNLIQNMAQQIWNHHYPSIIGQAQVDYMLSNLYQSSVIQQQMDSKSQEYFIVKNENSTPVGFVSISVDKNKLSAFVNKFYILPEQKNRGLGSKTFNKLLDIYKQYNTYQLQVNRQNYTAINFYFKLGFKIVKVADFDIGNGYFMNDFIMEYRRPNSD